MAGLRSADTAAALAGDPQETEPVFCAESEAAPLRALLFDLLLQVTAKRAPEVARWLHDRSGTAIPAGPEATPYLQALNIWFQLQRIAEENAAMRHRRRTEAEAGPDHVQGSFAAAFSAIRSRNLSDQALGDMLASLRIRPCFTAHPTEAKRVTILEIHRRLYRRLVELETERWTPRERQRLLQAMQAEIDLLWLTGELRLEQPKLKDEIAWGLQFFRNAVFDAVPQFFDRFDEARPLPSASEIRPKLAFHSWIGGDRDGNPNVTSETTEFAIKSGFETALSCHIPAVQTAAQRLSISERIAPLNKDDRAALAGVIAGSGADMTLALRNPNEIFRQALSAVLRRLEATREGSGPLYADPRAYLADLRQIERALQAIGADALSAQYLRPLCQRAETFGFRTTTLDIRQNSKVINEVLHEIWQSLGLSELPGTPRGAARLRRELSQRRRPLPPESLSPVAQDLLALLRQMRSPGRDPDAFGPFIVSMTRSAEDILAVYLLALYAAGPCENRPSLAVVPLFETIEDLRAGPDIIAQLMQTTVFSASARERRGAVEIMLGYSDSGKDGGFLAASWELHQAQRRLTDGLARYGCHPVFFHGRGGSASRGGAPTGRAIAAQPADTVKGALKVTEQGEVVSAKYANRGTALYNLELLTSAVISHSATAAPPQSRPDHDEALAAMAGMSEAAWAGLVNSPGFVRYFQQASPVDELSALKLGSRPARRHGARTLADLRAIPWVFAWSQNRHMLTGWYGFGSAVSNFIAVRGAAGNRLLAAMVAQSPLFRIITDEVEKALCQADMEIAARYAALVSDEGARTDIYDRIRREYDRSRAAILLLTGQYHLAGRFPQFLARFERQRPHLDRCHMLQIALLRESREGQRGGGGTGSGAAPARIPLLQSMNCIAAGLGWTG